MPIAMASSISSEFRIRKHCFNVPDRIEADLHGHGEPVNLGEHEAKSFAKLLPLLGCGEEAAALAFDGLATCYRDDDVIAKSLKLIAHEERVHEAILGRLSRSLPPAPMQTQLIDKTQRLHIGLTRGGTAFHLARIAALDSAVCTMLCRLLHEAGPIAADPLLSRSLSRIRRDEGGHVRLSRKLALELGVSSAMREVAAEARSGLADVLRLADGTLETLGVDAHLLDREIRQLPNGLLAG